MLIKVSKALKLIVITKGELIGNFSIVAGTTCSSPILSASVVNSARVIPKATWVFIPEFNTLNELILRLKIIAKPDNSTIRAR
jgi:hypothetical protein